jgi:hypothetical protein
VTRVFDFLLGLVLGVIVTFAVFTSAQAPTQGAANSGTATVGAPVKTGAVYNTAQPTLATGQVSDAQATQYGAHLVATGTYLDPFKVVVTNFPPTQLAPPPVTLAGLFGQPISATNRLPVTIPILDPCQGLKQNVAISQTATTRLVAGQDGKKIAACYLRLVAGAAEIPSLWEGTGAACGTSTLAVSGSATTANGESYAANGGVSAGTGSAMIATTSTAGNDLCLAQNGANRLAGNMTYVLY